MAKRLSDRVKELEAENARLMEQLKTAHTKIESYSNASDDAFLESGSKRQMESEIEKWKGLYKAKESHNKSLQEQLTAVKKAYQEAVEQLEQLKEQRSESKRNERGAGRKPTEQTARFAQFCELYNSGSSRKEIEDILGITDATYFRYQKLKRDRNL